MAEYIKLSAAIEAAKHAWAKGLEPSQYIEALPAADVAPVVHGLWVEHLDEMECSGCKRQWNYCDNDTNTFNYCPNCGAKMDGGDNTER